MYYFNTKELIDNKFGTPNPILFCVVDSKIRLNVDVSVRCSGVYSYRIADLWAQEYRVGCPSQVSCRHNVHRGIQSISLCRDRKTFCRRQVGSAICGNAFVYSDPN